MKTPLGLVPQRSSLRPSGWTSTADTNVHAPTIWSFIDCAVTLPGAEISASSAIAEMLKMLRCPIAFLRGLSRHTRTHERARRCTGIESCDDAVARRRHSELPLYEKETSACPRWQLRVRLSQPPIVQKGPARAHGTTAVSARYGQP